MNKNNVIPPEKIAEWQSEVDYVRTKNPADLSFLDRLWDYIGEFFNKLFSPLRKVGGISNIGEFIFWGIIILTLGIIIFFIFKRYFNLRSPLQKNSSYDAQVIQPNEIEEIDFDQLIEQSKKNKDWKLYTRFQFLQLLQTLNQAAIIEWSPEKTNQHYALELAGDPFKNDFQQCRRLFETIWYGEKETTPQIIEQIQTEFTAFNTKIKNR
jgi:hypothetical protein